MNLRHEWKPQADEVLDRFYSKDETVNEVIENFDIRRKHSAEGEELTIDGVTDWCLVQTSSNPLKELDDIRKIHCPLSMNVHRGSYVIYENDTWLIDSNVINVGNAYWTARMNRCSYLLKWQNADGKIIERKVISSNATAYNKGLLENKTLTIGTDQLMLFIPYDEETKKVKRGTKFFIDHNMDDPMTYELTRPDRTSYVFSGVGCINWLVTECAYSPSDDDLKYGVCDYFSPTHHNSNENDVLSYYITGDKELWVTTENLYTAKILNQDGENVNIEYSWDVVPSHTGITWGVTDKVLTVSCNDFSAIGHTAVISLKSDNEIKASMTIVVANFL